MLFNFVVVNFFGYSKIHIMPWLIFLMIIPVFVGFIFMNSRIHKRKIEHIQKIEQLKKKVVELAEKQLMLKEKVEMAGRFKISSHTNFEKLNKEISGLFELMMKMLETREEQKGKT